MKIKVIRVLLLAKLNKIFQNLVFGLQKILIRFDNFNIKLAKKSMAYTKKECMRLLEIDENKTIK